MRNVSFSRAAGGPLFVGLMAGYLTVTAAPAGDDSAWLRGANCVPSYARNHVQIWDRREDLRRVEEQGRRLGKPVVIHEIVMRPQQPHPAPPPLRGEALPVPRLLFGDATRHGRPFAKDPSVLRLGDRYLMYYSMAPSTNPASPKGWAIGIAESRDLTDWQKVGEILPEQPCEQNGLVNGKALLLGGKVHLFYNSYGNGRDDALCHASSDDGLKFTRHPDNPIRRPTGAWNSGRAIDCDAFEFRDKLWLIYATRDPSMQTQMLVAATADLRSDFGREAWTPVGDRPILKPELPWETRCIEAPSVIQRGDTLYLFYGGGYNNDPQQIGCASSTDGVNWTRLFREPLIPNGQPGDWNSSETGHPGVFTDTDGRTYLFVQGNQDKGHTWFLSAYEITWQHGRPAVVWDSDRFPMKRPGPAAHSEDGIAFSPGWTCGRGEGPRGGGLHYANRAGATATWETHGGDVTILHKVGPDGGLARVLIDGQPAVPPEFDSYAPTVEWHHRRVLATNLPPGRHTVTLVVLGKKNEKSSDTYVQIVEVEPGPPSQYILFNRAPGQGMYQGKPESLGRQHFEEVLTHFPNRPAARIQTGLSYVFSPLRTPPATTLAALRTFLAAAAETATPVLIQIDLEHWWEARPDLWNWWDPARAGYDPANRENVEWTGWSPEQAVKVAWRNWGQQIRVLPPPNLASPRYLAACREEIRRLVPVVLAWHAGLPADQKHLLVGIKLGHETSIGVNAFHFPNGNALLDRPPTEDPVGRLDHNDPVSRGLAPLGHAALAASGIRTDGTPTEAELREVARRYLETLCREAAALGVPRDRLFAHGAGWREGELIYDVPVNPFACPGWSFYQHAADPRKDVGVQRNLARSDAPYWAATEWLLQGPGETDAWRRALANTLSDPRCRYVCIFNWESIQASDAILRAVSELISSEDR